MNSRQNLQNIMDRITKAYIINTQGYKTDAPGGAYALTLTEEQALELRDELTALLVDTGKYYG